VPGRGVCLATTLPAINIGASDRATLLIFTVHPAYIFVLVFPMERTRRKLTSLPRRVGKRTPSAKGNGGEKAGKRNPGHERQFYLPGEPIRLTGIYEVLHDRDHRVVHEVVMHAGDLFPECDTCKQSVRFRLVRNAPYIFEDEDFAPET
jgi:hypothetical protein